MVWPTLGSRTAEEQNRTVVVVSRWSSIRTRVRTRCACCSRRLRSVSRRTCSSWRRAPVDCSNSPPIYQPTSRPTATVYTSPPPQSPAPPSPPHSVSYMTHSQRKYATKCFSMAPHIRSHRAPCSCFPKKVSLQLSSEQSVGDVRITQLDWKRVS